jgi:DNA-binding NarL/FixJ family response regulator
MPLAEPSAAARRRTSVIDSRTRVLVLYRHPLMGEGLARMLSDEPRLDVTSAEADATEAVDRALAAEPNVVVFEEGGPVAALEVLRRASCHYVIDVSLSSREAWAIRGGAVLTDPDHLTQAIVDACLAGGTSAELPVPAEG